MKVAKYKSAVDISAIILIVIAIITGFILHKEVWHLRFYNDEGLWGVHELVGLLLLLLVAAHCIQHSFWFINYSRIKPNKKRVTTVLLILGIITALSGIMLMYGSESEIISHTHYVAAILFTIFAAGHVIKRFKILKTLICS